ncbi:MAG: proteasome-activating nucleotidase [Methanomicrobia archaeon]|jgi:proteasome regulatory subunit|nr:proteasome-activating nucleotidase [Methanomicrobia archaeon]
MKASSSGATSSDEYSRYLQDQIKRLEDANTRLKERLESSEREGRYYEDMRTRYESEIRKLRSELEKLRAPPLIIGTVVEIIDEKQMVVRSSTGPRFVVNYSHFIDSQEVFPGAQVGLNQQSLAVVSVLSSAKDPLVYGMTVIESPDVCYDMIGGLAEQINEIREVVELPLTEPERFARIGVVPPKGVLLVGKPGTGKTMLAKAVANSTAATFIRIVGSELVQKYIGEGARMVRELFELAKEKAPSILFIDEIDAIAARRIEDGTSGEREVQRTMMQLLAEIDGFDQRGEVRIIGATNRPDILDPALLRPGRFDRIIEVPMPKEIARREIFKIHTAKMKRSSALNIDRLVALTENFNGVGVGATGADIKAICIEAGMLAARNNDEKKKKEAVEMEDFEQAIKKVKESKEWNYAKAAGVMFA